MFLYSLRLQQFLWKVYIQSDLHVCCFTDTERTHSTLKASLALLCGCLHTMKVRIRQTTKIILRTDRDQAASPPWTATTQKTHTKTPGEKNKEKSKARPSDDVQSIPSSFLWALCVCVSPSTLVQMLTANPDRGDGSVFEGNRRFLTVKRSSGCGNMSTLPSL